jgi:hypothetical protein
MIILPENPMARGINYACFTDEKMRAERPNLLTKISKQERGRREI